jgi:hypothetical protein
MLPRCSTLLAVLVAEAEAVAEAVAVAVAVAVRGSKPGWRSRRTLD